LESGREEGSAKWQIAKAEEFVTLDFFAYYLKREKERERERSEREEREKKEKRERKVIEM